MYKKLSFIFIFILILMCLFCIKSYASTDCSVYDEISGKYTVNIPNSVVEELGLPFDTIPYYSDNEDIYFFIENSDSWYYIYFSDVSFVDVISASNATGCSIKRSTDDNKFYCICYDSSSSTWYDIEQTSSYYVGVSVSSIIFSSDNIVNTNTGDVKVPKTVFSEEDTGDSGDSGDTDSDTDSGDILVTDGKYTSQFIEDYLNVGQSPFDAFKIIIDYYHKNYPDVITFSSSELPKYGLLVKYGDYVKDDNGDISVGDCLGYAFVFTSVPTQCLNYDWWSHVSDCPLLLRQGDLEEEPYYFKCKLTSGGLTFYSDKLLQHTGNIRVELLNEKYYRITFIASNYDVLSRNDGSTVVFQQPTLARVTTLAPVVNKVEMSPIMKEIIIILPIVIVALVGLIGLRKALKTLFQVLRRS